MNKKLLLIWTFLLCFVMGMSATEETFDLGATYGTGKDFAVTEPLVEGNITLTFTDGSNPTKFLNSAALFLVRRFRV